MITFESEIFSNYPFKISERLAEYLDKGRTHKLKTLFVFLYVLEAF